MALRCARIVPLQHRPVTDDSSLTPELLEAMYGNQAKLCDSPSDQLTLVFSQHRPFDLVELEQLLEAVGWSRRPVRRVRKALDNSLLRVAAGVGLVFALSGAWLVFYSFRRRTQP